MKRILVAAATATSLLACAGVAMAQDNDQHRWRGGGQGGQGQSGQGGQSQSGQGRQGQSWQGRQGQSWQGRQGGQGGQSQTQNTRPDWNAYFRNNPDLQRDYQHNRQNPAYHESQEAYAQRHYQEHGRAEGRNLPTQQWSGGQGQSWQGRQGGQGGQGQSWQGRQGGQGQSWQGRQGGGWSGERWGRNDARWHDYRRNTWAQQRYRIGPYYRPNGWYYRRWTFGQFLPSLFFSQDYWIDSYGYYGLPAPPPGCVWVRYGDDALLVDRYTGEIIQVMYNIFY